MDRARRADALYLLCAQRRHGSRRVECGGELHHAVQLWCHAAGAVCKLPRYRCRLGCILLKIVPISLTTGGYGSVCLVRLRQFARGRRQQRPVRRHCPHGWPVTLSRSFALSVRLANLVSLSHHYCQVTMPTTTGTRTARELTCTCRRTNECCRGCRGSQLLVRLY